MFQFWAARKVSFPREGTDKLGFARLRGKPDRGRLGHNKQRKKQVLWGNFGVVQSCVNRKWKGRGMGQRVQDECSTAPQCQAVSSNGKVATRKSARGNWV